MRSAHVMRTQDREGSAAGPHQPLVRQPAKMTNVSDCTPTLNQARRWAAGVGPSAARVTTMDTVWSAEAKRRPPTAGRQAVRTDRLAGSARNPRVMQRRQQGQLADAEAIERCGRGG